MINQSTYPMQAQFERDGAPMCAAARKTCLHSVAGVGAAMWTAPRTGELCVRITRKHVTGLNGHLEGVF